MLEPSAQVLITRFPGEHTVCGQNPMLWPMDRALEGLLSSSFMREWFMNRMRQHLEEGGTFQNISSITNQPVSIYKLATDADVMCLASAGQLELAKGEITAKSARTKTATQNVFHFAKKSPQLEALKLPKQAKQILSFVWASNKLTYTEAELEVLLETKKSAGELVTTQLVMRVFNFYKKPYLENKCLVESAEQVEVPAEESTEE